MKMKFVWIKKENNIQKGKIIISWNNDLYCQYKTKRREVQVQVYNKHIEEKKAQNWQHNLHQENQAAAATF